MTTPSAPIPWTIRSMPSAPAITSTTRRRTAPSPPSLACPWARRRPIGVWGQAMFLAIPAAKTLSVIIITASTTPAKPCTAPSPARKKTAATLSLTTNPPPSKTETNIGPPYSALWAISCIWWKTWRSRSTHGTTPTRARNSTATSRRSAGTFEVPGVFSMAANGLTYDGYAAPRFTDYLSYFTTRHQHPNPDKILARQGLADYSNRGFFSAGTNIESENNVDTLPDRNPAAYTPTDLYVDWQGEPLGSDPNAKVTILQGSVPDSLPGGQTVTNIPLTTYGAWDKFLRPVGKTDYSLNRYNYDAQADLLDRKSV